MMKRIYTWKSGNVTYRRVFVIGNYAQSLQAAINLANVIAKDFPSIHPNSVEIGVVTRSQSIKGYRLATVLLPDDAVIPPGWEDCGEEFDFAWD